MSRIKYPRTKHLPWTGAKSRNDLLLKNDDVEQMFNGRQVVITEKMDGENTTIYHDCYTHARSIDSDRHEARTWTQSLAAKVGWRVPADWRICGENLYAVHSIQYTVPTYFMVFGVYDDKNTCLSWNDTEELCKKLSLMTVPVLYKGIWSIKEIHKFDTSGGTYSDIKEGYVVRIADSFHYDDFGCKIAKFVRPNHVNESGTNWMTAKVIPNKLIKS